MANKTVRLNDDGTLREGTLNEIEEWLSTQLGVEGTDLNAALDTWLTLSGGGGGGGGGDFTLVPDPAHTGYYLIPNSLRKLISVNSTFDLPPETVTRLGLNFVPRSSVQVGIDTDGVPYFSTALSFAEARPVLIDTDGVPYVIA